MTHVTKRASIAILAAIFILTLVFSIIVVPPKAYADSAAYQIGDIGPGGGKVFYVDEANAYSWDYLEAAPLDQGGLNWSNIIDESSGAIATGLGAGQANTIAIISQLNHTSSAAKMCADYVSPTGYSDWYLPSEEEAVKIWENRIQAGIEGLWQGIGYWSSTEKSSTTAYTIVLNYDSKWDANVTKDIPYYVRAIRYGTGMKSTASLSEAVEEPAPWVRDVEMTCYQVWINEDNNFEFVFWWEYKNNNWVKIYDMEENEVFSIDMKKGHARFEADLPDGFYTVKTFHNGFETPIQEFLIGKP